MHTYDMLCSLKRICHITLSHGHLSSPRWLLRSLRSRLRAVSSLQSYSRETHGQAHQRRVISEGVFSRLVPIPCNITSWFAVALAEIRTRWILREKADCKRQSACARAMLSHLLASTSWLNAIYTTSPQCPATTCRCMGTCIGTCSA